ncbi:D-alanyl-D-alanine carboxypeptidase [Antarcticibacterium sp. 1MA-6-2]|uniref:D-alanyl-D-alanine carboxypeptidase n=1 Tax=Antarcticibacterium sp. 1MA-6-2 TaxID=2908210 RepID=UPI0021051607|nr:D-alanyl-D-alanine carboxypeptidase [Antarcticibacterium sp. 1MA-6-2]
MKPKFIHNIPIVFLLILFGLLFSSCSTSRQIDKKFKKEKTFEKGFSGLAVYDLERDKMIYERNSGKYFTPASNTKLFTFYTGLKVLGDSVPGLKYFIKNDSLFFTGTGDPSLLNPDLPESPVLNFLKKHEETLVYVAPLFEEEYFGPGWAWDDYNSYYSVERTAFPIYGNRVHFQFPSDKKKPKVLPGIFTDSVFAEDLSEENSRITRELSRNRFSYSEKRPIKAAEQNVPFKYSSSLIVKMLSDTLQKKVGFVQAIPEGFGNARTLYSIPVDSMYKTMLQVSDNFIAEQLLLLSAGKLSDTLKADIAIKYMQKNHLKTLPDEIKWVDGSGLSRYNLFTPASVVELLKLIYEEVPQERLFDLLAVGGVSGTIKNNYA